MDLILLWTIWATAITTPPNVVVLDAMCRATHADARITISQESLSWNDRNYPTAMIICARPAKGGTPDAEQASPEKKVERQLKFNA